MAGSGSGPSVLKKIYFIKRARKGEELTTLLKNKFKSIDAIRDLLQWFEEGRDFVVSLHGGHDAATSHQDGSDGPDGLEESFFGEGSEATPAWAKKNATKGDADGEPGKRSVVISPWLPTAQNYRNLIDVVGTIISWMDKGRDFDIALVPQRSFDARTSLN